MKHLGSSGAQNSRCGSFEAQSRASAKTFQRFPSHGAHVVMTHSLDQEQAANILGLTPRRLRQMDREADPPPRLANGRYPGSAFCHWMLQRSFTQRSALAGRAFKAGIEAGTGAAFWRTVHELHELARPDGQAADEEALVARVDSERRAAPSWPNCVRGSGPCPMQPMQRR